jgi:proteasome accessory factor B
VNRTERLLDLITYLLNAREPVPWKQIKSHFPEDYDAGVEESNQRKFERDKSELISLGIPIDYQAGPEGSREGYLIRKDLLFLPELSFTPREFSLLLLGAEAVRGADAFPYREPLESAVNKIISQQTQRQHIPREIGITYGPQAKVPGHAVLVNRIQDALERRKFVEIDYHSFSKDETTSRTVSPYGLILRRGSWTLVGWDHLREDLRSFVVNRIRRLQINSKRPGTPDYEIPEDFSLQQFKNQQPWEWKRHDPIQVVIDIPPHRLNELLPQVAAARQLGEGRFELTVTNQDGLISWVLWQRTDVRILSPAELNARIADTVRYLA